MFQVVTLCLFCVALLHPVFCVKYKVPVREEIDLIQEAISKSKREEVKELQFSDVVSVGFMERDHTFGFGVLRKKSELFSYIEINAPSESYDDDDQLLRDVRDMVYVPSEGKPNLVIQIKGQQNSWLDMLNNVFKSSVYVLQPRKQVLSRHQLQRRNELNEATNWRKFTRGVELRNQILENLRRELGEDVFDNSLEVNGIYFHTVTDPTNWESFRIYGPGLIVLEKQSTNLAAVLFKNMFVKTKKNDPLMSGFQILSCTVADSGLVAETPAIYKYFKHRATLIKINEANLKEIQEMIQQQKKDLEVPPAESVDLHLDRYGYTFWKDPKLSTVVNYHEVAHAVKAALKTSTILGGIYQTLAEDCHDRGMEVWICKSWPYDVIVIIEATEELYHYFELKPVFADDGEERKNIFKSKIIRWEILDRNFGKATGLMNTHKEIIETFKLTEVVPKFKLDPLSVQQLKHLTLTRAGKKLAGESVVELILHLLLEGLKG